MGVLKRSSATSPFMIHMNYPSGCGSLGRGEGVQYASASCGSYEANIVLATEGVFLVHPKDSNTSYGVGFKATSKNPATMRRSAPLAPGCAALRRFASLCAALRRSA